MTNKQGTEKCNGAHCKCMDIGGQCPNMHWYHCKEHNPEAYAKGTPRHEILPFPPKEMSPSLSLMEMSQCFSTCLPHREINSFAPPLPTYSHCQRPYQCCYCIALMLTAATRALFSPTQYCPALAITMQTSLQIHPIP